MANRVYFKGMTADKSMDELKAAFVAVGMELDGMEFSQVTCKPAPKNGVDVIIYVSSDEDEPYRIVSFMGDDEGDDLDMMDETCLKTLEQLREFGVCTELFTSYPNGEKYGIPSYAAEEDEARMFVSEHGFSTPETNLDFETTQSDSGDDTPQRSWMRLKVPQAIHAELKI